MAGEQNDHLGGRSVPRAGDVARPVSPELAVRGEPFQLFPGRAAQRLMRRQSVDEIGRLQSRLCRCDRHTVSRYWWIILTVAEPSPTADATRLPEPWRTSPAANTPGTLVSNKNGSRISGQPRGG